MTAYRRRSLSPSPMRLPACRVVRGGTYKDEIAPDAVKILQGNVYGWFERIERGLYGLTASGRVALVKWADQFPPA